MKFVLPLTLSTILGLFLLDPTVFRVITAQKGAVNSTSMYIEPLPAAGGATSIYGPWSASINFIDPTIKWIKHRISRGETLSHLWKLYGSSTESAILAANAMKESGTNGLVLRHGEEVELGIGVDGRIRELRKKLQEGKTLVLLHDNDNGYTTQLIVPEITEHQRTVTGVIQTSFVSAATGSGVPYDIVDDFVDLFGGRVEFSRSLQPGDTFVIQYNERTTSDNERLPGGDIRAASIRTGGKKLSAIRHDGDTGKPVYFDELGNALGNYFLRYPLQFTKISSTFSDSRMHPILGINRPHNGVDFAAPTGTAVRSVADGVVQMAGWSGGGGGLGIRIRHNERWSTVYLHLSRVASGIRTGTRVTRGEIIGAVGSTGLATGPHLHFGLFDHSKYVNPLATQLPQLPVSNPIPHDYLMAALQSIEDAYNQISDNAKA